VHWGRTEITPSTRTCRSTCKDPTNCRKIYRVAYVLNLNNECSDYKGARSIRCSASSIGRRLAEDSAGRQPTSENVAISIEREDDAEPPFPLDGENVKKSLAFQYSCLYYLTSSHLNFLIHFCLAFGHDFLRKVSLRLWIADSLEENVEIVATH
jgi:hypothetical protein